MAGAWWSRVEMIGRLAVPVGDASENVKGMGHDAPGGEEGGVQGWCIWHLGAALERDCGGDSGRW